MAVKVGNSWVSETAYAYAKSKVTEGDSGSSMLNQLAEKFPDSNFSMNTAPFQGKGTNNIAIAPNILKQMEEDPEKRIEYEALIYDCNSLSKSLSNQDGLIAHGFIINSDGTLGAWSISKSGSSTQRNQYQLNRTEKGNWLKQILEKTQSSKAKKKTTEKAVQKETVTSTRKTAADELSYLSKKYSNYSLVAANYSKGMQYGSNSTTNVAISPQFLAKMASDPELEAEYEGYLSDMQKLDEEFAAQQAKIGWSVEQGWAIDKDGGISSWAIGHKDPNAKSHLQTMSENAEKIRKQNEEKRKEKAELEEKRQISKEEKAELEEKMQEAGNEKFGNKFKGAFVLTDDGEETDVYRNGKKKEQETVAGINLDMKV